MTREVCEAILHMESVCESEGIGPDFSAYRSLIRWIVQTYPDLADEYGYLSAVREVRDA